MFELLLLFILIRKKLKTQTCLPEIHKLCYNPGLISENEIENAVQEMQKNVFQATMLIYTQILSLLKNKTVIQFQMYGLGSIWRKGIHDLKSNGTIQLAVALKLISKFKENFPEISVTSQEPKHMRSEIEYLQNKNMHVLEENTFSANYFSTAIAKSNASDPVMICYMIHFPINVFERFLNAHWSPEILSKIIFVGNWFLAELFSPCISDYKKTKEYFRFVTRKTLPFDKPKHDYNLKLFYCENYPFHGHISDFLAHKGFHFTDVYSISYENAKKLVQQVS